MIQYNERTVRAYGVSLVIAYLTEYLTNVFKEDNQFFKRSNKYLLKQLIDNNTPILAQAESLRKLEHRNLDLSEVERTQIDSETLSYEMEQQFEMVMDFVKIFVKMPAAQVADMGLNLNEILLGNRLYTKADVQEILRTVLKDVCRMEANELLLEQYVNA